MAFCYRENAVCMKILYVHIPLSTYCHISFQIFLIPFLPVLLVFCYCCVCTMHNHQLTAWKTDINIKTLKQTIANLSNVDEIYPEKPDPNRASSESDHSEEVEEEEKTAYSESKRETQEKNY